MIPLLVVLSDIVRGELKEGWGIHDFRREYFISVAVGAHIPGIICCFFIFDPPLSQ